MWSLGKKSRCRRLELRKGIQASHPSALKRFWDAGGPGAAALAMAFFAFALSLDLYPPHPLPYREGQFVPADIHSRVAFRVMSPARLEEVKASTPAYFIANEQFIGEIVRAIEATPNDVSAATQPGDVSEAIRSRFALASPQSLEAWRKFASPQAKAELEKHVREFRDALYQTVTVNPSELEVQQQSRKVSELRILFADESAEDTKRLSGVIPLDAAERIQDEARRLSKLFPAALQDSIRAMLTTSLADEATYSYDATRTEEAIAGVVANPPERVYVKYSAGHVLVSGSRPADPYRKDVKLTQHDLTLLQIEHEKNLDQLRRYRPWQYWGGLGGRAMLLGLVTLLLCVYIARLRMDIIRNRASTLALVGTFILMLGVSKVIAVMGWPVEATLLPVLLCAIVLTIGYDQRFAWTASAVFAIFVAMQHRLDMGMFLVYLVSISATVFQLREIRTRSKLLLTGTLSAMAAVVTYWAASVVWGTPWGVFFTNSLWAGGAAVMATLLVQGMLPVIERVFGVATSLTLLEWGDDGKPLLRRMAMEAPGTYNHSLQLGALCEAAAESIGARGLLARVGARYHDIGKINKPDYFIENQAGSSSRHAKLSPAMSLLIIIGHVKDGIELAREYGLPRVLHEFIMTHHGTTLVQYFYKAATEQRKSETDRAPDEVEFRYPGPKPRSKEAAILMLADAAESSVRAMSEPSPGRIENQVHTMISRRLMDGQLSDCDLTLREVHLVEASLIKSLTSMYHHRIPYPTPPGQKPSAGELLAARQDEERRAAAGKS